jgi:hypothetical protein
VTSKPDAVHEARLSVRPGDDRRPEADEQVVGVLDRHVVAVVGDALDTSGSPTRMPSSPDCSWSASTATIRSIALPQTTP